MMRRVPGLHPASAAVLALVDGLWSLADWKILSWWLTIPAAGLSVLFAIGALELLLARRTPRAALGRALVGALVAAVPTPLLGWVFAVLGVLAGRRTKIEVTDPERTLP